MNDVSPGTVVVVLLLLLRIMLVLMRSRIRAANRPARPVDLSAFHALMDRADEALLRERLPRAEFVRLKRLRIRITWKYMRRIANNAAVVLRQAAISRQDPNINIGEVVAQVTDLARKTRLKCLVAFAKLAVEFAFPNLTARIW